MWVPTLKGIIDRRMLINFTVDADVALKIVPYPFRPKLVAGKAIAGVCLIRLKDVRMKGLPAFMGSSSENGAHRIAVEWEEDGKLLEGVYIPRRDTSSLLNMLAGGRVFPGKHFRAQFTVEEPAERLSVSFKSSDGTSISVVASAAGGLSNSSIFKSIEEVSEFFRQGAVGYSPNGKTYDGIKLNTEEWRVDPLAVEDVHSSFFEDESVFPAGSVKFDNALLMTDVAHEWVSVGKKDCS